LPSAKTTDPNQLLLLGLRVPNLPAIVKANQTPTAIPAPPRGPPWGFTPGPDFKKKEKIRRMISFSIFSLCNCEENDV
jgi:hypothetical protein